MNIIKKINIMKMKTNQFFASCEANNEDKLASQLVDAFIQTMRSCNPDMKHLAGSDWLSIMLNDYHIEIVNGGIDIVPNGKPDLDVYLQIPE